MNAMQTFDFEDNPVRTIIIDGEAWFVGKDVCRCLGIVDHHQAIGRLSDDEKRGGCAIPTPGGEQSALCINEPGVYRLIFESRKPEAEAFRRWVLHEVLPAIRRTGRFEAETVEWDDLDQKLSLVKAARLTYGRKAAQQIWERLGLPPISDEQAAPAADTGLTSYLMEFLEECTEADASSRATATDLYRCYQRWAGRNKAPHFTPSMFGRLMRSSGYRKMKSGSSVYVGLRIKFDVRRELGLA